MPIQATQSLLINSYLVSLFYKQLWLFALPEYERKNLRGVMNAVLKDAPCDLSNSSIECRISRLNNLLCSRFGPGAFLHSRYTRNGVLYTQAVSSSQDILRDRWIRSPLHRVLTSVTFNDHIGPLVFTSVAKTADVISRWPYALGGDYVGSCG